MSYKKHLVLSNGTDQINLMSAGAINDKFSVTLYPYSVSIPTAVSGLAANEIVKFEGNVGGEDFVIKAQADSSGNIAAGTSQIIEFEYGYGKTGGINSTV